MTRPQLSLLLEHLRNSSHLISLTDAAAGMAAFGEPEDGLCSEDDTERLLDQYVALGILRKTDASNGEVFYWLKETLFYQFKGAARADEETAE